jgi:hypothetical protein
MLLPVIQQDIVVFGVLLDVGQVARYLGGEALPNSGIWSVGCPIVGGIGFVLFMPKEMGNGDLPDKNGNGIPDIYKKSIQPSSDYHSDDPCK